jgi:hypothetical protein
MFSFLKRWFGKKHVMATSAAQAASCQAKDGPTSPPMPLMYYTPEQRAASAGCKSGKCCKAAKVQESRTLAFDDDVSGVLAISSSLLDLSTHNQTAGIPGCDSGPASYSGPAEAYESSSGSYDSGSSMDSGSSGCDS